MKELQWPPRVKIRSDTTKQRCDTTDSHGTVNSIICLNPRALVYFPVYPDNMPRSNHFSSPKQTVETEDKIKTATAYVNQALAYSPSRHANRDRFLRTPPTQTWQFVPARSTTLALTPRAASITVAVHLIAAQLLTTLLKHWRS